MSSEYGLFGLDPWKLEAVTLVKASAILLAPYT
jgi:hypothetical protein